MSKVLNYCREKKSYDIELLIKFLFSSGLRIGEACGLTKENIDFDLGKGKVIRSTTKSNSGVRDFYFDKKLSKKLEE